MDKIFSKFTAPQPPPNLTKENLGVWNGWAALGDKEIVREAVTKGTHVELAIKFLSLRKNLEIDECRKWYNSEVGNYIQELLERKQIFKASHILNNIGLEANIEFKKYFRSTTNDKLRDYIGNHLIKNDKLDEDLQQLWHFLRILLNNDEFLFKFKLETKNIDYLHYQTDEWKAEVATILFLSSYDIHLTPFITPKVLWDHLIITNDIKAIKAWINIKYSKDYDDTELPSNLLELFRKYPILHEQLNLLIDNEYDVQTEFQNDILNEFAKYGIIRDNEKMAVPIILQRFLNSSTIGRIYQIINSHNSTITLCDFKESLAKYCVDRKLYNLLGWLTAKDSNIFYADYSNFLSLICDFRNLVKNFNNDNLSDNIFNVAEVLSVNVVEYFNQNPLIFLLLILLTEKNINNDFYELLNGKTKLIIDGEILLVPELKEKLPILKAICDIGINGIPDCDLTIYDLLDKHLNIDSVLLFNFRFNNDVEIPKFSNTILIQNYGYTKTIDFKFFLRNCRPSAAAQLVQQTSTMTRIDELKLIEQKTEKMAIINFNNLDIATSCIVFLQLLNFDSQKLRVKINAGNILLTDGHMEQKDIIELIMNSDDDPNALLTTLEETIIKDMDFNMARTGDQFIQLINKYDIVMQFTILNNLKLPEQFLKHLAAYNLWLPFFIFAQIYNYPEEQIRLLIQFFKSPSMAEHLTHSVLHDIRIEDKNVLIQQRDTRNYYLSKIGVRKSIEILGENLSLDSQIFSEGSSSVSSDFFEIDISNLKATLLQTLIQCHNSTDPPRALLQASQLYRNPTLAIFATSYEPDSLVTNWLTWVAVSCELCQPFTDYEQIALYPTAVTSLLEKCITCCYPRAVHESFLIFLPENPLRIFMEFLLILLRFEVNSTAIDAKLHTFQKALLNTRKNSVISDDDLDLTYLQNRFWIETTALKMLGAALHSNLNSLYEQIFITDVLNELNISENFPSIDTPYFQRLYEVLKCLNECNNRQIKIRFEIDLYFEKTTNRQAVINCINTLLDHNCFKIALNISKIEHLPPDLVLVKEAQYLFEVRDPEHFWKNCDNTFKEYKVTADCVVDFYSESADKINNLLEKYSVLKLATKWATEYELSCQYELEKKMWITFLQLDEKYRDFEKLDIKSKNYLYKDLVEILKTIEEYNEEIDKDILKLIERLIIFIMNRGNFWEALKLQKYFGVKNTDLETLKLSHSLAEGIMLPYQLDAKQRLLLSNVSYLRTYSNRKTFLSTKFSSLSSSSHSPVSSTLATSDIDLPGNDTLAILKLLSEHLIHGIVIGQNIFMLYRISINIEVPYHVVLATDDHMVMLKNALDDNCNNKLDVVHDFFTVFKTPKYQVADFICEELVNVTTIYVETKSEQLHLWDLDLDTEFSQILQLLQDNCTILGDKIFNYANTLHQTQQQSNSINYVLIIELIIRAHDCFTADCNMQGISQILKKSKELTFNLLTVENWKLIVRLLTGVARYSEMTYVFQILMENDQFEFLLRKGVCKKDNAFKMAVLDYLNKYCPDNRELYKIVALHFTLFSEVALLWEKEAQNIINNLISISKLEMQNNKLNPEEEPFILLQNNEGTKISLKKVIENYTHATQFHLQGEKLTKAADAAKQAELVALQLSLLNDISSKASAICILNLNNSQISTLISTKFNFEQSLILIEAYNYQINWAMVLYEQYVRKNDYDFFEGYMRHFTLTESLVYDISRKFINNNINTITEIQNMKRVVESLHSVHMKYKIASELGFIDLIEDLLNTSKLVYLKDTVWKRGYKN